MAYFKPITPSVPTKGDVLYFKSITSSDKAVFCVLYIV